MQTTARWEENVLMVRWYGGSEDEAAFYSKNKLVFDGNDDTFVRSYSEKPSAEKALADILAWQNA